MGADSGEDTGSRRSNFITDIIDADLEAEGYDRVVTRFPPEPNGYLHIGHAKSICLNFGLAEQYGGRCHLRFDDTNPVKEEEEFVRSIQQDVAWLGFEWGERPYFASDFFEEMYDCAVRLIRKGKAYVDSLSKEAIREHRGSFDEPGRPSPYRDRSAEENLDLFERMRKGEFAEGEHVLRARIDMASPNMLMRDPLLYRILRQSHHRTGDDWCIYPMYDFAHCLEDAHEGVTHSICTLEFEQNRELYDWVLREVGIFEQPPKQIEFARLELGYTVMSKRKLLQLIEEGYVDGWDDPRMPTIAGLRRRGITPGAIRRFADMIGVSKTNSVVDIGKLEYCIRDDLNHEAPRVMGVLRPLKVTLTTWPEGQVDELEASYWPHDVPREGSRKVPFGRELYIERDDFMEDPPKKWFRLAPGKEVRLRYGYVIRCDEVVKDATGEVVELRCSHDPATRGGHVPDGRKIRGTLHWVSAEHAVPAEVRLYDRLFQTERPDADPDVDFHENLNPGSLEVLGGARVERSLAGTEAGTRYQFERQGYFVADAEDSRPDALVFNRIIGLKDSWAKMTGKAKPATERRPTRSKSAARRAERAERGAERTSPVEERDRLRAGNPTLKARYDRYVGELGLERDDADVLTGDEALSDLFEAALAVHASPRTVANWVVNEVLRELKEQSLDDLPFGGAELGRLVALVDDDTISSTAGKEVFAHLVEHGGDPDAIVEQEGLRQVSDEDALRPVVERVLAAHPDEAERLRGGEGKLLGFFIGQVMRETGGKADPKLVRSLLRQTLDT